MRASPTLPVASNSGASNRSGYGAASALVIFLTLLWLHFAGVSGAFAAERQTDDASALATAEMRLVAPGAPAATPQVAKLVKPLRPLPPALPVETAAWRALLTTVVCAYSAPALPERAQTIPCAYDAQAPPQ